MLADVKRMAARAGADDLVLRIDTRAIDATLAEVEQLKAALAAG